MSRKRRKFEMNISPADKFIGNLKYKDLKRECVIRGMDFDLVVSGDIPTLSNWIRKHFDNLTVHSLLNDFDDHQEVMVRASMGAKDQDPDGVLHPALRLGYIAERDGEGNVIKKKRVRTIVKKKKKKRERTKDGIFQGTKKAYTYSLQQEGKDKKEVIKLVLKEFPDASEKSISIWFNKSRKLCLKLRK